MKNTQWQYAQENEKRSQTNGKSMIDVKDMIEVNKKEDNKVGVERHIKNQGDLK